MVTAGTTDLEIWENASWATPSSKPAERRPLGLAVVSIDPQRLLGWLRHHRAALAQDYAAELLIFGTCETKALAVDFLSAAAWPSCHLASSTDLSLNAKRNVLLRQSKAHHLMFLDDDAYVMHPTPHMTALLENLGYYPQWLLCETAYYNEEHCVRIRPHVRSRWRQGSSIEWNQVLPSKALREIGGWAEDFGPGAPWPSGESYVLTAHLWHRGWRQEPLACVTICHPAQVPQRGRASLRKFSVYRFGLGAAVAATAGLSPKGFTLTVLAKVLVLGPILGLLQLLQPHKRPMGLLRLATPYFFTAGLLAYWRQGRRSADS